ncbi:hypothetical protein OSSY52_01680 [Tepiditoga spiralis]|uniref:Signal transduction histidine kinase internal region domain-containing protein n=1 Tax=Tepiditoga spiralis TaxID=2108365 RepID=A0A7G1G560_9BACT|nr:histidine kinase [Tepiditoga spiralis]BBE30027.1 hypothetical protein OSSY52_01680 [Tepiditoga spiralis]
MKLIKNQFLKIFIITQIIGVLFSVFIAILVSSYEHFIITLGISLILSNSLSFSFFMLYYLYKKFLKKSIDSKIINNLILFSIFMLSIYIGFQTFSVLTSIIFPGMFLKVGFFQGILLLINGVLILGTIFLYLFYYKLKKEITKKIIENNKLKENMLKSELAALQSKINPHFLFNTLNSILDLAYSSPKKVEEVVINLSGIYRKILYSSDKKFQTLEEEFELIKKYLDIEKIRMGDRLEYEIIIDESIKNNLIPPLIIEPIVENSVIHGISKKKNGGKIFIEAMNIENKINIVVKDNGVGFEGELNGFGIKSVKERLKLLFKDKSNVKINSTSNGTTVKITFPKEVI